MPLTIEEFTTLRDFIYERTGIYFEEKKLYFLESRVSNRVAETNSASVKEYYRFLKYQNSDDEVRKLINLVTINETYFYRDLPQMSSFSEEILPIILEEKKKNNDKSIRIWSAACSTGEEPYTIAIILKEMIKNMEEWKIEIIGSDINTEVLRKCEEGVYIPRSVKDVAENVLKRHFRFDGNNYIISDEIKKMVSLKQLNLYDSEQVRKIRNVDVLFCRNVLIYFDDKSKKKVVNDFFDILNKGGFVLLGVGETMGRISASFNLAKLKKALVYRK